jgi:hypothetical protein
MESVSITTNIYRLLNPSISNYHTLETYMKLQKGNKGKVS